MTEHVENVFKKFQDQIMYLSTLKKTEEIKKAMEDKGDQSKTRLKRVEKHLLKMFGKKIQDDEDSASDCSYNLYNKMGQKNIAGDATKS